MTLTELWLLCAWSWHKFFVQGTSLFLHHMYTNTIMKTAIFLHQHLGYKTFSCRPITVKIVLLTCAKWPFNIILVHLPKTTTYCFHRSGKLNLQVNRRSILHVCGTFDTPLCVCYCSSSQLCRIMTLKERRVLPTQWNIKWFELSWSN